MNKKLEEILHQSSHLMARKTYHGTSMRDLAKQTGYSLSGLYNYFKSKEELLYLINYHGFSTIEATLSEMLETLEDPHEKLYALVYNHIQYFVAHRDEMKVMMLGTQELDLEKSRIIQNIKQKYTKMGQEIVRDIYVAETGCEPDAQEISRKTYLLFGMLNWIFGWYSPRQHGNAEALIQDIYATFLHGIGGGKTALPSGKAIQALHDTQRKKILCDA